MRRRVPPIVLLAAALAAQTNGLPAEVVVESFGFTP